MEKGHLPWPNFMIPGVNQPSVPSSNLQWVLGSLRLLLIGHPIFVCCMIGSLEPMNRENRVLVTFEPVEFVEQPVQFKTSGKRPIHFEEFTDFFWVKINKEKQRCQPYDLGNTRISTNYALKSPRTCSQIVSTTAQNTKL